jgi:hypothetical protein
MGPRILLSATVALSALATARAAAPIGGPAGVAIVARVSSLPIVAEHHYRVAAKIRPLLFFWIGRDNVGGTRIVWRRGADGSRGWELLIGSDPDRAPRRINRWGYVCEEQTGTATSIVGVMKQSDERSLDDARSSVENESKDGYVFKLLRARAADGALTSTTYTGRWPRDYTYRDLSTLLAAFETGPVKSGPPRQLRLGSGVKPGFLTALADLIHDSVYTVAQSGASRLSRRTVPFAYNATLYDLRAARPRVVTNAKYGEHTYPRLLEGNFEVRNTASGGTEAFTVVYGIDGPLAETPVFIAYQPRWWFKVELLLDDAQERF